MIDTKTGRALCEKILDFEGKRLFDHTDYIDVKNMLMHHNSPSFMLSLYDDLEDLRRDRMKAREELFDRVIEVLKKLPRNECGEENPNQPWEYTEMLEEKRPEILAKK